jgi:hypothetical protein|tara:strand:+ start:354 stop:590 length:237 start_codon:yes stop_codon:yes gene_type:complete
MKVKLIRGVMVAGLVKKAGSTLEVEENVGRMLLSSNKAELFVEPVVKKAAPAAKKVAAATPKVATPKVQPSTPKKETA